ncbi:MAG: sensor histidine kinase [Proteobacteria bacterium]|nr:sensor histidine kinase [Pseudomonadota bacterium]
MGKRNQALSEDGDDDVSVKSFNLIRWFTISGLVAITLISVVSGIILSRFLTENMLRRDSIVTAEFVRGVIGEANRKHALQPHHTTVTALDHLLRGDTHETTGELGGFFSLIAGMPDVLHANVYSDQYAVVWSSQPALVGKRFTDNEELKEALAGETVIEIGSAGSLPHQKAEHALFSDSDTRFVENYIPIWNGNGTRVVAVAEIYKTPMNLFAAIDTGRQIIWFGAVLGGLILFLAMYWIALRADKIIRTQQEQLLSRSQKSSNRIAEINERYLRRIGADLHDGPAQLISYALLRLDSLKLALRQPNSDRNGLDEMGAIRDALHEAMSDIRELSAGLTLAKLEEMSPLMVLKEIVGAHERRTQTTVNLTVDSLPKDLPLPLKISVFRFVQEALNNAYRHGGGIDQKVTARSRGHQLELTVSDSGPGFEPATTKGETDKDSGLGLIGLRERIESLGATLQIQSRPGDGTQLTMRCRV